MPVRLKAVSSLAVALAVFCATAPQTALALAPASRSGPPASALPYDARRGVFSFAPDLEGSLPAVVQVTTLGQSRGPSSDAADPKPYASGSGVIVDAAQGILITNNHVVEGGRKFTIDLTDGRLFNATLIGADKATDIAVLKITPDGRPLNLKQVQTVDSDTLRTGDLAFAVGYPLGLDQTLTMGVVSGLNRSGLGDAVEDYIQTDAAVNSGNSGGPLLDSRGRLIGINTSILSGGMGGGNDGIAFAVPTRIMLYVADQIRKYGEVRRGETGAVFGSLNAKRARELGLGIVRGAVVADLAPGSPAERAGLRLDDVVTRIQGRPVANAGAINATVGIAAPGSNLNLVYLRDGRERTTALAVETPHAEPITAGASAVVVYGATLRDQDGGVQLAAVEAGSPAAQAGLTAGDLITAVDGRETTEAAAVVAAVRGATGAVDLTVMHNGEAQTLTLQLSAAS
ncbi:trypsin-like peptidase domain-containing protein [Brevundimonas sp. SORGH_AS_0993]|uniref:trypsin-like peptidase domain-containing protein n=1 Tax=Brevundimonas sp. SORGH_AS_0993 TaxID=3041794 RepID=UPI00277EE599|nr:trypsin-like peptidase domain-containing protein [Brevundimonas sp. SORGH_AS_0993]MDQ1154754.1 serine protease DegQ [Brevundimonas sp. SORGH_AS_0993]